MSKRNAPTRNHDDAGAVVATLENPLAVHLELTDAAPLHREITAHMAPVLKLKVKDAKSYALAGEAVMEGKRRIKAIKEYFEADRKRADELHKSITQKIADAVAMIEPHVRRLSGEMIDWQNAERERERVKAAKAAAEEAARQKAIAEAAAEELRAAGMAEAAEAAIVEAEQARERAPIVASVASRVPKVAGFSTRTEWTFEVQDIDKIPREYFQLDTVALAAVVRAQKNACRIPGIRVFSRDIPVTRAR